MGFFFTSLVFLFLSFTPLGSSSFAERTRPWQSTTETLRMHPQVSSTSQRLREKLMLAVHGYSCIPRVPHQRISVPVATICVLFHTNWCVGTQTDLTGLERRQHITWMYAPDSRLCVAMWVCEARNYLMSLSSRYFHLHPFFSASSLNKAFPFKQNKIIYGLLWLFLFVFLVCCFTIVSKTYCTLNYYLFYLLLSVCNLCFCSLVSQMSLFRDLSRYWKILLCSWYCQLDSLPFYFFSFL